MNGGRSPGGFPERVPRVRFPFLPPRDTRPIPSGKRRIERITRDTHTSRHFSRDDRLRKILIPLYLTPYLNSDVITLWTEKPENTSIGARDIVAL